MKKHLLSVLVSITALTWLARLEAQSVPKPLPTRLPTVDEIVAAVEQNAAKVSNLRVRSTLVSETSPLYWGDAPAPAKAFQFINGKEVKIERDLGFYDNGKLFVDRQITSVTPRASLQQHSQYWLNKSKGIGYKSVLRMDLLAENGNISRVNGGVPTAYEVASPIVPFPALGQLQVTSFSYARYLKGYNARVVGMQEYLGLPCVRLDWDRPAPTKDRYSRKGYVLICPARDYKELYREEQAVSSNPNGLIKNIFEKTWVEKIERYGDAWLPSLTHSERQETPLQGEVRSLKHVFRLIEFEADVIQDDTIFTPHFSPGTRVFRAGVEGTAPRAEVAGGDISLLLRALRKGDGSVFQNQPAKPQERPADKPKEQPK